MTVMGSVWGFGQNTPIDPMKVWALPFYSVTQIGTKGQGLKDKEAGRKRRVDPGTLLYPVIGQNCKQ